MKPSELTGPALDWAVAKCEGEPEETLDPLTWECTAYPSGCYNYSTDWSQGGPIIEREGVKVEPFGASQWQAEIIHAWVTGYERFQWSAQGPTPLVAAMRCYVASKLGDDIDVPGELK